MRQSAALSARRRGRQLWFGLNTRSVAEGAVQNLLLLASLVSIVTTVGIVAVLIFETVEFFQEVSILEFLTDRQWTPLFTQQHFGIAPLFTATVLIAVGAMTVALPIGLVTAIYLSEYAPDRLRSIVKPILEVLAGIPTIVYGYFALLFITPILRAIFPQMQTFNAASAAIVMGIMIVPYISSLSEEAMGAVPRSLREAAYALGSTKMEVATRVVVPAAASGIVAAFILGVSRAIGETMIVAIAAGQQARLSFNPLQGMETMTAYIVQVSLGDTPTGTIEFKTIFAVGMALFLMTFLLNMASRWLLRRFREVYQ